MSLRSDGSTPPDPTHGSPHSRCATARRQGPTTRAVPAEQLCRHARNILVRPAHPVGPKNDGVRQVSWLAGQRSGRLLRDEIPMAYGRWLTAHSCRGSPGLEPVFPLIPSRGTCRWGQVSPGRPRARILCCAGAGLLIQRGAGARKGLIGKSGRRFLPRRCSRNCIRRVLRHMPLGFPEKAATAIAAGSQETGPCRRSFARAGCTGRMRAGYPFGAFPWRRHLCVRLEREAEPCGPDGLAAPGVVLLFPLSRTRWPDPNFDLPVFAALAGDADHAQPFAQPVCPPARYQPGQLLCGRFLYPCALGDAGAVCAGLCHRCGGDRGWADRPSALRPPMRCWPRLWRDVGGGALCARRLGASWPCR
jgi:hypothetical protein